MKFFFLTKDEMKELHKNDTTVVLLWQVLKFMSISWSINSNTKQESNVNWEQKIASEKGPRCFYIHGI